MSYQEAYQESYTKYPNRYNDIIKPRLTDTQRDICDVVIRMTYGWHQTSATIPNSVFIRRTNKTKQGIIKAKKQLEKIGLLIVLKKGGGSRISEYMLNLWYDNPDRSVKVAVLRQEEELLEIENPLPEAEQEEITELLEDKVIDKTKPEKEEYPPYKEEPIIGQLESEDNQEPMAEISDTVVAETLSSAEDSEPPTGKLSLPPYKEDLSSNILSEEKKQTVESKDEKAERKEATAAVCSLLRSWGTELEPNDYAFVGWSLKTYGTETVNGKIQIMEFQRNRGVRFSNPLGWLRNALTRSYGLCRRDTEILKAKERTRKEIERSKLEQIRREREIREMERLRNEAEGMKNRLAPEKRDDLRKAAIEQFLGMDGMTEEWLNECAIESVENQILRERVAA